MTTFATPGPVALRIQNGAGRVGVHPEQEATETHIELTALNDAGARAIESAVVSHDGDAVIVEIPEKLRLLGRAAAVAIDVRVPSGSSLDVSCGSADLTVDDGLAGLQASSGSGDVRVGLVTGDVTVRCGSGDVLLGAVTGTLDVKTGSGDIVAAHSDVDGGLYTGSGDVRLGTGRGRLAVRTGSGDVTIDDLTGDLDVKTGSGDTTIGSAGAGTIRVRGASGGFSVAVADGTATWLDLDSISGHIDQQLDERAAPTDDQPRLAITASTVSGDIRVRRA